MLSMESSELTESNMQPVFPVTCTFGGKQKQILVSNAKTTTPPTGSHHDAIFLWW